MSIWEYLFTKKNRDEIAAGENVMATASAIMTKSESILNRIFDDYKMMLLNKEPDFVIFSVFGMNRNGALTEEQSAIHGKIDPVVRHMIDIMGIEHMTAGQKMAILFIIRMMMAHKLLFMMELLRNATNRRSANRHAMQKKLEEMETLGHA